MKLLPHRNMTIPRRGQQKRSLCAIIPGKVHEFALGKRSVLKETI
jgi:hypothetical protein